MRMTVEDVFAIRNRGVVATGRIDSGAVRVGDTVQINGERSATVGGIEMFPKKATEAWAGDTVGILLTGIDKADVKAGDVLTAWHEATPL
ncbi:MAG: EF-Tu/IF-2/RF-3 family GTPase [Actinomycetota bacterium]